MDYNEALSFIHSTNKFGMKLGLENMRNLMEALGNPQKQLKFIHIAGTNGKGSTSAIIHSILMEAGYQAGLFISPYLEEFTERIQINGHPIDRDELADITQRVKNAVDDIVSRGEQHPTEFELVTAIGMVYFQKRNVDFVILEVGLGGRLDATNIIETSEVSVITAIGMDHMEQLGHSIEEIAAEKAGIIKKGGQVVLYPQGPEVLRVIQGVAHPLQAQIFTIEKAQVVPLFTSMEGQSFSYQGEIFHFPELEIQLLGHHQIWNAATAIRTMEVLSTRGYRVPRQGIVHGVKKARWPGRFELIQKNPMVLLDGAHNPQGVRAFVQSAKTLFPDQKLVLILGILRDKKVEEMLESLLPLAKEIITIAPDNPRALPAKALADHIRALNGDIPITPMDSTEEVAEHIKGYGIHEIIAFTGSLYMIGAVRKHLRSRP